MISFSVREIFSSVIYSILFGGLLAIFFEFSRIISFLPETISLLFHKIPFSNVKKFYARGLSIFQIIFFFFLFTMGSILLSYFVLDGMVRIYVIILSLIGFFLVRKWVFYVLVWIMYSFLSAILYPIAKLWRKKHL